MERLDRTSAQGNTPSVSVVIPTTGRETLEIAIASALRQNPRPAEVLVVYDTAEVPDRPYLGSLVRVLGTGGGAGQCGSHARSRRRAR